MKRSLIFFVPSLLLVVSIAFAVIMVYINRDVVGRASYEETRQNFTANEPYFQKTADCFLEIANCCLSGPSQGTLLVSILESDDEFLFRLFFSTKNETELVFPIGDSGIEITQDQKEKLQFRGIDYHKVQTLYSNLKKTNCCAITKCGGNPDVLFYMTFKILDHCTIDYIFYPQSIEVDSIRPISNSSLGQQVAISVK